MASSIATMSNSELHSRSEISWKTRPELHLRAVEGGTAWYYRDDVGALVPLDSTHMLLAEYGEHERPAPVVALVVHNATDEAIELVATANGNAVVTPPGPQTVGAHESLTWQCGHGGGQSCTCGSLETACLCGSWSITGASPSASPIPDPTFKVRWQAHGELPSPS